ncbi:hypothetical protein LCGC14_0175400 [marine sediment metagenome]|uniref:Uncharacterized protein n=1 Tax=marine sediment metagenome TaxID=412755 RepID=A0A0F9X9K7_9ZZZZ
MFIQIHNGFCFRCGRQDRLFKINENQYRCKGCRKTSNNYLKIERWYTEKFNGEIHESTAVLDFHDICTFCKEKVEASDDKPTYYEEETTVPPLMECLECNLWIVTDKPRRIDISKYKH